MQRLSRTWHPMISAFSSPISVVQRRKVLKAKRYVSFNNWWCFLMSYLCAQFATAISTRAALTFWYRSVRPHESTAEWRFDVSTGIWWLSYAAHCNSLLTLTSTISWKLWIAHTLTAGLWIHDRAWEGESQSRGSVTVSTCPISRWHAPAVWPLYGSWTVWCWQAARNHTICKFELFTQFHPSDSIHLKTAYLMAFLMLLRIEETVNLEFESIDIIPGESEWLSTLAMPCSVDMPCRTLLWCQAENQKVCPDRYPPQLEALCEWQWPKDMPHADDHSSCTIISKGCQVERSIVSQGQQTRSSFVRTYGEWGSLYFSTLFCTQ